MSAADVDTQRSNMLRLNDNLVWNPAFMMMLMPVRHKDPYRSPQGVEYHAELRIETAGRTICSVPTVDFAGAKSLADSLLNKINGPNHKPGGKSKLVEIPCSGNVLIYPPWIVGMLIAPKTYKSGNDTYICSSLLIETCAATTFSVDFDNAAQAREVQETLLRASRGNAKLVKRKIDIPNPLPRSPRPVGSRLSRKEEFTYTQITETLSGIADRIA